jgi:hypothetical protein
LTERLSDKTLPDTRSPCDNQVFPAIDKFQGRQALKHLLIQIAGRIKIDFFNLSMLPKRSLGSYSIRFTLVALFPLMIHEYGQVLVMSHLLISMGFQIPAM